MESKLCEKLCQTCRTDSAKMNAEEKAKFMQELSGWRIASLQGVEQLIKEFDFSNFEDALQFTNRVAEIAQQEGHHPALVTEWGKVTVHWWTHKIKGLHLNDFICAAKTDKLARETD
ncbi:4a-hydroxytetrahydrobiopterin dehydratase [Aliikangiella sp. G2MR2-5]|uniref:4a-hydroxytetrahydrobiopterin dehydratase n=1 Tax=Aliikangiella sp. G2MR2-5 TaxID=2788943 RepID=UPI001FEE136D|nr:4a-hydroxytetrahydrobiopterin dehydratase [Aliikangiella sp. G2MR2-5]